MNTYNFKIRSFKKMAKVSNEAIKVLSECEINGNKLFVTNPNLDRKLYLEVNKILENISGKWDKKSKSHIFSDSPEGYIDNVILTGDYVNFKKEFQFFPTPKTVVEKMLSKIEINENSRILEPSAGNGNILKELVKYNPKSIVAVEIQDKFLEDLNQIVFGFKESLVFIGDFMKVNFNDLSNVKFNTIIANPPFTKQQDIKHFMRMFELMNVGDQIVCILSSSSQFRTDKKSNIFNEVLNINLADIEVLSDKEFKESGTSVSTIMVSFRKQDNPKNEKLISDFNKLLKDII
jgi:phospholipid N-methyltransferase